MSDMPIGAVARHRIFSDGVGVVTLAGTTVCHLKCRYCINKDFLGTAKPVYYTPEQLYDEVKIDNLYFLASDGGITFGGGEPLLFPDFIADFSELVGGQWKINVETSLNVPKENLKKVLGKADRFIVDIKDMNGDIYAGYCGCDNKRVIENLKLLSDEDDPESVMIRIPSIRGFNTEEDCEASQKALEAMGFVNFERFEYTI